VTVATFEQLTAARDALTLARASGVREVRDSDGSTTVYKSDAEMAGALSALEGQISQLARGQPARQIHFTTSKGL